MPKGSSAEDHLFPMLATSTLEIRQKVLGAPRWQPGRCRPPARATGQGGADPREVPAEMV